MTNLPEPEPSGTAARRWALHGDLSAWWAPAVHPVYTRLLCAELLRRGFSRETVLGGTGLAWEALHRCCLSQATHGCSGWYAGPGAHR